MIYFVGIGGIGISALAGIFSQLGIEVAGSDQKSSSVVEHLNKMGIMVFVGQTSKNIDKVINSGKNIQFAVSTTAVPATNPEIIALKQLNIPILTYPQTLGLLTNILPTVGIAGTHGKTTTTGITIQILKENGFDLYAIIGAFFRFLGDKNYAIAQNTVLDDNILVNLDFKEKVFLDETKTIYDIVDTSKIRSKKIDLNDSVFVIEADEYKDAFFNHELQFLACPAIEYDHLDYFKTKENYLKSFAKVISNVKKAVIIDMESPYTQKILKLASQFSKHLPQIIDWRQNIDTVKPVTNGKPKFIVEDSAVAFTLAKAIGIPPKGILESISRFSGVWRRFEFINEPNLENYDPQYPTIISDYAHNPRKVEYALEAFNNYCTQNKKTKALVIFQPHQYYRLYSLQKDFIEVFKRSVGKMSELDLDLWIVDIFDARSPKLHKKLINSKIFALDLQQNLAKLTKVNVLYVGDVSSTLVRFKKVKNNYDAAILLTAGDLDKVFRSALWRK